MNTDLFWSYGIAVIRGTQLGEASSHPTLKSWGWVAMVELEAALLMETGPIIQKYGPLSDNYEADNRITIPLYHIGQGQVYPPNSSGWNTVVWVPAGWVSLVLEAFRAGVHHFEVAFGGVEYPSATNCWNVTRTTRGRWVNVYAFGDDSHPIPAPVKTV